MKRVRPTSVTVMGILNIVFGSLSLLCITCVGVLLLVAFNASAGMFPGRVNPLDDLWAFMKREAPAYAAVLILRIVLGFLLSLLLLIAGIGLLNMKNWGRALSIVCSIVAVLCYLGSLIFTLAVENPSAQRWQQDFQRRNPGMILDGGMGNSAMNNILAIAGDILRIVYAILLLIMMLTPTISAAFAGRALPSDYEAGGRDDEGDDYERGRRRDGWND